MIRRLTPTATGSPNTLNAAPALVDPLIDAVDRGYPEHATGLKA